MPSNKLKTYAKIVRNEQKILSAREKEAGREGSLAAELIRNTHSIEKGLSISSPRLGFGHAKQKDMMEEIRALYGKGGFNREACEMAIDALREYLRYHEERGYSDDFCKELEQFLKEYPENGGPKMGGTLLVEKSQMNFDTEAIEEFFRTRHSIRDFDSEPVDEAALRKALSLAQTAPSACNRQGVRAYVLSQEKSKELAGKLAGIGGFAQSVSRFILIAGKTSAYRQDEINQYIVSSSIFAAYLSLTLHLYGLGACVVQRSVIWSKDWEKTRSMIGAPEDEQLVCILAVGNLKDRFTAPLSHRMTSEEIVRFID